MPQGPGTYGSQKGRPSKAMKGVKVLKKGGKVKLKFLKDKKSVEAPKGFHWMEEQGRYYLMKGDYKPHPGAVAKAKFKIVDHGKSN
jgi:hypothetical protein